MIRLAAGWVILALALVVYHNNLDKSHVSADSVFSWHTYDKFDEINDKIRYIIL